MPEIGSKCVPKQVDRGLKEPKAAHDTKTIGRNQRLSRSCTRTAMRLLQLNIGCGHDTAENVDLEQQLVKNREARPVQYVRQPDIYLLISFEGRMMSIQLYRW